MVTRRLVLQAGVATIVGVDQWRPVPHISTANATQMNAAYSVFPLLTPVPHPLAKCSDIEVVVKELKAQLQAIVAQKAAAGAELRDRVLAKRREWQKLLLEANATSTLEQKKLFLKACFFAAGLVLTALGVALSSPMAIGAVLGAQIIVGAAGLVASSILKTEKDVALILGYTKDRTLTMASIIGEAANSTSGRIVGHSITAVQIGLELRSIAETNQASSDALAKAKQARAEIAALDGLITDLGEQNIRWANLRRRLLEGAISGLERYIRETKSTDCRIVLQANLPTIRKP